MTVDTTLPPGLRHRGQLLLSGRIRPRDAEPLALAYATRHILTHISWEPDAFHRSREEVALAELRASLGVWPWSHFGDAALQALVAGGGRPSGVCLRCRANMVARVYGLHRPGWDSATVYLLGNGCSVCRRIPVRPPPATADTLVRSMPRLSEIVASIPPGAPPRTWELLYDMIRRNDPMLSRSASE